MSRKSRLVVWQKGKPMYSYKQILVENIQRLSKERGIGKTEACEESGAGRIFISGSSGSNTVCVQVTLSAPSKNPLTTSVEGFSFYFQNWKKH